MFETTSIESAGVRPRQIVKYLATLQKRGCNMHSVLLMRDGKVFFEHYYPPFTKDFCHRMYSQTKSFVAVAIGLLQDEGRLDINDPIVKYFPEKIDTPPGEDLKNQTIREMLTMTTSGDSRNWFRENDPDRTHLYLNEEKLNQRPAGTVWRYDSAGSQVLSSLVEKLAGMSLLEYLRKKLFDKMECFSTAEMLKTKNEDSWGDSAMICTTRDVAHLAELLRLGGVWQGERLISEDFVKAATAKQVDNREDAHGNCFRHGYGYQIWRTEQNGFAFVGMGDQLTICLPDRGFVFACTADNQTSPVARNLIVNSLFDMIVDEMADEALEPDPEGRAELYRLLPNLKLRAVNGMEDSPLRSKIDGVEYIIEQNNIGIESLRIDFENSQGGIFRYVKQGKTMELPFFINKNRFGEFPELGYSGDHGGLRTRDGSKYRDAVSAAWLEEGKLMVYVQIIDRYFGNLCIILGFKDGELAATFTKNAEDFLWEYQGLIRGRKK